MKLLLSTLLAAALAASGAGIAAQPKEQKFDPNAFMREHKELVFEKEVDVAYGKVYQFRQQYRGNEVFGASCTVSTDHEGNVLSVNDNTKRIGSLPKEKITPEKAQKVALSYGGEILSSEKVISGENPQMCYDFKTSSGLEILVSASSGKAVSVAPLSTNVTVNLKQTNFFGDEVELPIEHEVEDGTDHYYLADEVRNIYCYDAMNTLQAVSLYENSTGVFNDSIAVSVYQTIVKAYDFYADEKNIGVSWKGIGGKDDDIEENYEEKGEVPLLVLIHYQFQYENANCGYDRMQNTAVMYVGDGYINGNLYNQGRSTDVIAHEYQHAITELLTPNGLEYLNETGAINEAISDIFGGLVEGHDPSDDLFWAIGEEAGPKENKNGIRSGKRPFGIDIMHASDELPLCYENHDHYQYYCDNGNVHGNCTLLTHAQYRMWEKMPDYFTRERIGTLWFSTVATLSYRCTFLEFAKQMVKAAENLKFSQEAQDVIYETLFESGILREDVETHLVTFRQGTTVLEKITVRHGQAAFSPTLPNREVEAGNYIFKGWNKDLSNVTQDLITEPVFEAELNKYTVRFMSDGKEISSVEVEYGKSATPPTVTPQREGNERCDYEFKGWDIAFDNVKQDLTVNALFEEVLKKYTVKFMSEGTEIAKMQVEYGKTATPPEEDPQKPSDERYDYTFSGWDLPLEEITADTVYTAQFKNELRKYHLQLMNGGEVAAEGYWHYEDTVTPDPLEEEGKIFEGWYLDEALTTKAENVKITSDTVLYAKWGEKKSNTMLIVGISVGALVVLGAGAAVIAITLRKRKASRKE